MELLFDGKKSYNDVLIKAYYAKKKIEIAGNSFVVHGDNFVVMASLLTEFRGKIDLIYIDPPFNTEQVFSVSKDRVSTISRSKKGEIAYSDVMSKDAFLNFMYERFVLIRELLSEKGSLYVHIDTKMGHYFKVMLDEIFGDECYKNDITRIKSNPKNFDRKAFGNQKDMILFYSKTQKNIWNDVRQMYSSVELEKRFSKKDENGRRYTTIPLHAPGESSSSSPTGQPWRGMDPPKGRHWRTDPNEFDRLDAMGLIEWSSTGNPRIKKYADEHKGKKIQDVWEYKDPQYPLYPTEKNLDMLELIIQQSSNEGSYVMDCFAGSGSTLLAAATNNRKFIGIDKSNVAMTVIKNRLEGFDFSYLDLDK